MNDGREGKVITYNESYVYTQECISWQHPAREYDDQNQKMAEQMSSHCLR
jgi:hypothetical protein